MVAPVIDINTKKKIRSLEKSIKELTAMSIDVKNAINNLTKWRQYRYINIRAEDLFNTYKDIKRSIETKEEMLKTLHIRNVE